MSRRSADPLAPDLAEWGRLFPRAERCVPVHLASRWWVGHVPFAFELMARLRPATVVELGTYTGTSLAAFCQAARECESASICHGIDTWEGDVHMGRFRGTLHAEVEAFMQREFPGVAVLSRKRFDDALADFPDGSIDLLHLDGTHTYEAVSHDFQAWLPRVSDRGVVLLHDTNVTRRDVGARAADFGVGRFFEEIRHRYGHIEFRHSCGLGVLLVGRDPVPEVVELIELSRRPGFHASFEAMGGGIARRFRERSRPRTVAGFLRWLLGRGESDGAVLARTSLTPERNPG